MEAHSLTPRKTLLTYLHRKFFDHISALLYARFEYVRIQHDSNRWIFPPRLCEITGKNDHINGYSIWVSPPTIHHTRIYPSYWWRCCLLLHWLWRRGRSVQTAVSPLVLDLFSARQTPANVLIRSLWYTPGICEDTHLFIHTIYWNDIIQCNYLDCSLPMSIAVF